MSDQNNKKENLTIHDAFVAVFYIIIICIGINHCITKGVSPSPAQLCSICASLFGIVLFKVLKYGKAALAHIREIIFPAILFVASLIPVASALFS